MAGAVSDLIVRPRSRVRGNMERMVTELRRIWQDRRPQLIGFAALVSVIAFSLLVFVLVQ